jgi:hypothetical protein
MASLVPAPTELTRGVPRADRGPSTGVAPGVVSGVVLRGDALFELGSNVPFYRKCSSIFLISNRPAGVITGPDQPRCLRAALTRRSTLTSGSVATQVPTLRRRQWWATEAGVSAREATRGRVDPNSRPRLGVAITPSASKTGLAIPPGGVTMCDRLESKDVSVGHDGGRSDGETRTRRRDRIPARRRPLGGGLRLRRPPSALCRSVPARRSAQAHGGAPSTRTGNRSLGFQPAGRGVSGTVAGGLAVGLCRQLSRQGDCWPPCLTAVSNQEPPRRSLTRFKTGGGATGTIRPSTSPRMPTSGFEDRGAHLSPCTPVQGRGYRTASILCRRAAFGL